MEPCGRSSDLALHRDAHIQIGLWTHIQAPSGGVVLRDGGQLVFGRDDAFLCAPARIREFFGARFCDALVP
jgi:hypothetical protein